MALIILFTVVLCFSHSGLFSTLAPVMSASLVFVVSYYKIVTSAENYSAILEKLREEGITFETDNGFEMLPITTIEVCIYS